MPGMRLRARDQLAAFLPIIERVLGPGTPTPWLPATSSPFWTGEAGDAAGARDQFAAFLPIIERVLGPEHPHTLAARDELAYSTEQADINGLRNGS